MLLTVFDYYCKIWIIMRNLQVNKWYYMIFKKTVNKLVKNSPKARRKDNQEQMRVVWLWRIIGAIWGSIYLGINESKTTLCMMGGANALPPHPSELLHLNQACVQHFICDLTDAHASAFRHGHEDALDLRAGLIDTYMDTQIPSQYSCAENVG